MKKTQIALATALVAAGAATAQAQDVKVNALVIAWYTQMLDSNLRRDVPPAGNLAYYALGGTKGTGNTNPYTENGFSIRRAELYVSAKITDEISGNLLLDPNQPNPLLLDAFLTWKPTAKFEVKVGQLKPIGYEATLVGAADLLFTDRSQVVRFSSDVRERGVLATVTVGTKAFGAKIGGGVFNGETGRVNDSSAQKDFALRVDLNKGEAHKFGAYLQIGSTNKVDKLSDPLPDSFGVASPTNQVPTAQEIFDNKDKTSTYGAYYAFHQGPWHAETEIATGLLGRRNPAFLEATGAAKRQHLDQKFLGYQVSGAYTMGHHILRARYDFMNYNQGDKWYTTYNPYTETAPGVLRTDRGDYTPKFTDITLGYTYAFNPELIRKANIKLDYIFRSKNFLAPRAGQVGEQGGDSLVAAFQVWF